MKKVHKSDERRDLIKAAKTASQRAQQEAKALGLTIKKIVNDVLLEEYPDGSIKEIRKINAVKPKGIKKGTVICLK